MKTYSECSPKLEKQYDFVNQGWMQLRPADEGAGAASSAQAPSLSQRTFLADLAGTLERINPSVDPSLPAFLRKQAE